MAQAAEHRPQARLEPDPLPIAKPLVLPSNTDELVASTPEIVDSILVAALLGVAVMEEQLATVALVPIAATIGISGLAFTAWVFPVLRKIDAGFGLIILAVAFSSLAVNAPVFATELILAIALLGVRFPRLTAPDNTEGAAGSDVDERFIKVSRGKRIPSACIIQEGCVIVLETRSPDRAVVVRDAGDELGAGAYILAGSAKVIPGAPAAWAHRSYLDESVYAPLNRSQGLIILLILIGAFALGFSAASASQALTALAAILLIGGISDALPVMARPERSFMKRLRDIGISVRGLPSSLPNRIIVREPPLEGTSSIVEGFELYDQRVELEGLLAVALALAGRGETPWARAISTYAATRLDRSLEENIPNRVSDLIEISGRGMSGVVHGVEFTLGDELFLLERGVLFQTPEPLAGAQRMVWSLAMKEQPLARFVLGPLLVDDVAAVKEATRVEVVVEPREADSGRFAALLQDREVDVACINREAGHDIRTFLDERSWFVGPAREDELPSGIFHISMADVGSQAVSRLRLLIPLFQATDGALRMMRMYTGIVSLSGVALIFAALFAGDFSAPLMVLVTVVALVLLKGVVRNSEKLTFSVS